MDSKQLNLFKFILFMAGLGVVGAAFVLVNHPYPQEGLTSQQKFLWWQILICYLFFFVPFFFSSINLKGIDTKITSTVNLWISIIIFEVVAITLAVLTVKEVTEIRIAVLIEMALVFILAIFVYFGYFAGNHIGSVQAQEEKSLSKIAELKNAFAMLNLKVDMWTDDFFEQKTKAKKLCDDVKYMSPVDTDMAASIEQKLIIAASVLAESNLTPQECNVKLMELTNLVNQRKLLRK